MVIGKANYFKTAKAIRDQYLKTDCEDIDGYISIYKVDKKTGEILKTFKY